MEPVSWNSLPQSVLIDIFLLLPPVDRFRASLTCRSWNGCFYMPCLWSKFSFRFCHANNANCFQSVKMFGSYMKNVCIDLDQYYDYNRTSACNVLLALASLPERRLQRLTIRFLGENPCFYAGHEFVSALNEFFGPAQQDIRIINSLLHVDLSGMTVSFTGELLDLLSENNPHLETLNIQNRVLVCHVQNGHMLRLVERCRRLRELCLYNYSLSEDILRALTADDRMPLQHLSVYFRREDKFSPDIPADVWLQLTRKLPHLRVTLGFDHTCPLQKVSEVMKAEIPVCVLRLETFTSLENELRLACAYYKDSLEKLVANSIRNARSRELDDVYLELSAKCSKLRSLHVFCVLDKNTVDTILEMHPDMKKRKTYTLVHDPDTPHPWIAGFDA